MKPLCFLREKKVKICGNKVSTLFYSKSISTTFGVFEDKLRVFSSFLVKWSLERKLFMTSLPALSQH